MSVRVSQDIVEVVINTHEEGNGNGDEEFALTGMILNVKYK